MEIPPDPLGYTDDWGEANAINDSGYIVGGGTHPGITTSWQLICAELWNSYSPANQTTLLPNCVQWLAMFSATSISSDNWVVGSDEDSRGGVPHYPPFLIVPETGCALTDLNALLDASGSGWTIVSANGINSQHQIVGSATSPKNGSLHAVLLTPNSRPLCYPD